MKERGPHHLSAAYGTNHMRLRRAFLTTMGLLLLVAFSVIVQGSISTGLMAADHGYVLAQGLFLDQLQYAGVFAIGWGVGVVGWLITGDKALVCLFARIPKAWALWRKRVFRNSLPVWKYLFGSILLVGLGTLVARQVWGIWVEAFDIGMLAGAVVGAIHSVSRVQEIGDLINFLEANQRHLNKDRATLFTEYDKP